MTSLQRRHDDALFADADGNEARRALATDSSITSFWKQARRSLVFGFLVALGFLACFTALLVQLPRLPVQVALGFCLLYVCMQTFAVPGTLSLSLLSGALYGTVTGLFVVSVISTLGASTCYCMSVLCGRDLVHSLWPDRLAYFGAEVEKRKHNMLSYIVLLRLTPVLPNTFINVASPMVDVPLPPFIWGTLLGCLPNNFVAVSAGSRLGELASLQDLYDRRLLLLGLAVGLTAIVPVVLNRFNAVPQMHSGATVKKQQ